VKAVGKEWEWLWRKGFVKEMSFISLEWKVDGMTDGENEGDDYDELICAGWGEPGEEWTQWEGFGTKNLFPHISNEESTSLLWSAYVPQYQLSTYGGRLLVCAAAATWNSLQWYRHCSVSILTFQNHLKTFLFFDDYGIFRILEAVRRCCSI